MKKAMLAMLLAFTSLTAFSQRQNNGVTPEKRAENQTRIMTESLSLSEEQQKKVYDLNLTRAMKMQERRDSESQNRTEMRASMETFNKELGEILTAEQQEKYKTMLDERRNTRGERGPKR